MRLSHILDVLSATIAALRGRTTLIIAPADRELDYPELSDLVLGRFARNHLILTERAHVKNAARRDMPLNVAMTMHASICLYKLCADAGVGELELKHGGLTWSGEEHGDWSLTLRRLPLDQSNTLVETP